MLAIPGSEEANERVSVAVTHRVKDEQNEYIDIRKNRVFHSDHTDVSLAYEEYSLKCAEEKKAKNSDSRRKFGLEMTRMTKLMKCVLICYLQSLHTRNLQPLSMPEIMSMLKNREGVFSNVIEQYFKTGAGLSIKVNNPKTVFDLCMNEFLDRVVEVVDGTESITDDEEINMYMEASKHFDVE